MMIFEKGVIYINSKKIRWEPLVICAVLTVFFTLLFYSDNKYQTPPPYGSSGILTLKEKTIKKNQPIFLIDGWLLTDQHVTDKPTYIGEFSNLQRGAFTVAPHGTARYRLTLRYSGKAQLVSVSFPQLASYYTISANRTSLSQGVGDGLITFLLQPGDNTLTVVTVSKLGYDSGMYFPPALGTPEALNKLENLHGFAYALAFLLPLALAAFTLILWRSGGQFNRCFGLLCCFYALYVSRYFIFHFALPIVPYWFFVQSLGLYGLCFFVVYLTAMATNATEGKAWRWMRIAMILLPCILLGLSLLIPTLPCIAIIHGWLTNLYYILTFCITAFFAAHGTVDYRWENRYALAGCSVFGIGLILNLFFSNRFEPIRFYWQFEWCGLLLVLLFGAMMVSRNRRILHENDLLTHHLEEQVKERTQELTQLLEERRAFFSDMAHDLKAPVFATQAFIDAIRRGGVGVSSELRGYLDQAEGKQQEMARRLQGLSTINALDKIEGEPERISIHALLEDIYAAHHGETEVRSVHLVIQSPETDGFILAQSEKLDILFENLIYNALRFTPPDGSITVCAKIHDDRTRISVIDTGCGIGEDELPLIFRRFFVGKNNKTTGTGLGLYIVKTIVEELGGSISASSVQGDGTEFVIDLPLET